MRSVLYTMLNYFPLFEMGEVLPVSGSGGIETFESL